MHKIDGALKYQMTASNSIQISRKRLALLAYSFLLLMSGASLKLSA
jgi:hypothetical protein